MEISEILFELKFIVNYVRSSRSLKAVLKEVIFEIWFVFNSKSKVSSSVKLLKSKLNTEIWFELKYNVRYLRFSKPLKSGFKTETLETLVILFISKYIYKVISLFMLEKAVLNAEISVSELLFNIRFRYSRLINLEKAVYKVEISEI